MTIETCVVKKDSTSAFGKKFIIIEAPDNVPEGYEISKMVVQIGPILKTYTGEDLTFPVEVKLSADESKELNSLNDVNILFYDQNNEPSTGIFEESHRVYGREAVVNV